MTAGRTLDIPLRGPEAIAHALKRLDFMAIEKEQREVIKSKKKTARPRAVRLLNILKGFERSGLNPEELMIRTVPVIPPAYRPFSITGETFLPGDANELYKDLFEYRRLYNESEKAFGIEGANEVYKDLRKATRALYGYDDSPNPKTAARGVKGFFKAVTGTSPKTSFYQSKMLSKTVDNVGRAVIVPDADLGMDQVGVPAEMAWKQYAPYVQRRMVLGGISPAAALKHVHDRTAQALKALESEMEDRPVYISRAPSWHDHNVVGQKPHIVEGDALRINPYIAEGANADYDGDQMTMHVPSHPDAVRDVKEKIMASKMPWSIKNFNATMGNPKHEQLIGLFAAGQQPSGRVHRFASEQEADEAIKNKLVDMNDDIEIIK